MKKKITDKQRLDWYDKRGQRVVAHYEHTGSYLPKGWFVFDGSCNPGRYYTTVRQAIDAAIQAEEK